MALSEQELEKQLIEAGKHLLSPPSSVSELVNSLDRVENLLTRVEQSPSDSMKKALSPSMKALVTNELLRHSDVDVNVSVASCISEITRITAPDAPYEDEQMKEVFQLIVSSFENLDDKSSPSYYKRTSILETVAKVRSCVVMLDLECDALIAEMFQHFFKSIRNEHPENVFSSMETIMTLVLEESEDISVDLLSSILDVLKAENKEILPVARLLGEKVTEKCATKLKPYLLPAIKSRGTTIGDYSKVVANVLQVGNEAIEPSDVDAASKNVADENDVTNAPSEKAVEVALETLDDAPPSEEVGPAAITGSPKTVVSNGVIQKEVEDTSAGGDNLKEENNAALDESEPSKTKVNSDAEQVTKLRTKREKASKRKGRKTNSVKSSSEPSEPTLMDEKEGKETLEPEEIDGKDVDNAQSEAPVADSAEPAENKKEPAESKKEPAESKKEPAESKKEPAENQEEPAENQVEPAENKEEPAENKEEPAESKEEPAESKEEPAESKEEPAENKEEPAENKEEPEATVPSPKTSDEPLDVPSPSPSGSLADETRLIKAGKGKKKNEMVESVPADVDLNKESDTKKPSEGTISQSKSHKRKGKKVSSAADKEDSVPSSDASKKEDEKTSELDAKSAKQSGKKVELAGSQRDDKKKKGQGKGTPAKDLTKTPAKDEGKKSTGSVKSTAKSVKDESDAEKASKSSSKRKRTSESNKTSKYGKELVGSKVKVWWPDDKKFYEGVVELFDPATGKHKVLYNDGDVENLKLEKEKWKLVEDGSAPDQGHSSDGESPDESTETPKAKKAKTSPVQGAKRGKTETSTKKAGASSSKSKATPKSRTKQKDDNKVDGKAKDETLKSIAKSDNDRSGKSKESKSGNKTSDKSVGKTKDDNDLDTSKGSTKPKQETPKSASKSKGKSSKTGNTNGSSKAKSTVSAMEEDTEDVESSPEPAKAPENAKVKSQSASKSKKSAKKRKRSTKG